MAKDTTDRALFVHDKKLKAFDAAYFSRLIYSCEHSCSGMALSCICKAPGIIHRGSVRERMETKTVIKAVVSLVPIGRGQRELMKPLFQLNVKSYSGLPKATGEENGKAKNLTWMIVNYTENSKWDPSKQLYRTKSQSSYLNIDLVQVESALSLRQYCYVNIRRLHVQSALRALNDRMTVDFEERSKHKLQSSTSSLSRPRKSYVFVSRELILGSAPKIRVSVHALQTRYYSSKSEESKKKQVAVAVPEGMVFEYTEGSRQPYQKIDFDSMTKSEVIAYYSNQLGTLQTKLKLYSGLVSANLSRCVLEKFVVDVLEKHGFVKDKPSAREIQIGFSKFLQCKEVAAIEFKKLLPTNLELDEIIDAGTDSFVKLSGVIHRALDSFLDNNDLRKIYELIDEVPRLTDKEKMIIDCMAKYLYAQKKK